MIKFFLLKLLLKEVIVIYYVYILKCADDSLYCGSTDDIEKRLKTHNSGKGAKYTRGRLPVTLVFSKEVADKGAALKEEYAIKQLNRKEKEFLISTGKMPEKKVKKMKFTAKGLDFLVENKLRDDREWFRANRKTYEEYVIKPVAELVMKLEPTIHEIDEDIICIPKITKSISRIFRDTRFSKDKSIFRDTVWCVFTRNKSFREGGAPAFYFEFSPRHISYGCGFFRASTEAMEKFRQGALTGTASFKKAKKAFDSQNMFTFYGEPYKRNRYPQASPDILDWVNRKNIGLDHYSTDFDWLFGDTVADDLAGYFKMLEPVYKYMLKCTE